MNKKCMWLLLIVFLYSGSVKADEQTITGNCGAMEGDPDPQRAADRIIKSLDQGNELAELLDKFLCPVDTADWEARALRAQMVIGMFARYGAARIPQYSKQNAENDAAQLLRKVTQAEAALAETLDKQRNNNPSYHLSHADLELAAIDVVGAALNPATKKLGGWLTSSVVDKLTDARQLLKNAVRDVAYFRAYRRMLGEILTDRLPESDPEWRKVWKDYVLPDTEKACNELRMLAKLEEKEQVCTGAIRELIDPH